MVPTGSEERKKEEIHKREKNMGKINQGKKKIRIKNIRKK
jgi:hypothetical protein